MRFDRNKAFPYPVLRPHCDDYVDVEFQTTVEFTVATEQVTVEIGYVLSSEELLAEVNAGRAKYLSVVSCRDTYFRQVLGSSDGKISATFDVGNLRGEVRVDPYIVATAFIQNYSSRDINIEFGKDSFSFSPGDVLAQDETQIFYIDRDLFKPITSVFELVKNEALSSGEWNVSLLQDHVQIQVSSEMKESIDSARNDKKHQVTLINSLYFSAVVQAIQKLREDEEAYEGFRWAEVIYRQLHNAGWDLKANEPYVLAQRLMKYPLRLLGTYLFGEGK